MNLSIRFVDMTLIVYGSVDNIFEISYKYFPYGKYIWTLSTTLSTLIRYRPFIGFRRSLVTSHNFGCHALTFRSFALTSHFALPLSPLLAWHHL